MRVRAALSIAVAAAVATPLLSYADLLPVTSPVVDPTVPAARETEPVILSGAAFGAWATPANVTAKAPLTDLQDCQTFDEQCEHNHYEDPEVDSADVAAPAGTPIDTLTGWRWDPATKSFVEVPFQVDEMFTRYLDNSASGFAVYSGNDQHTAYAFDREGFRYTRSSPDNPCIAVADSPTATDPVQGLDTNDEVVFMASDAGAEAPADAKLPHGATGVQRVTVADPLTGSLSYLYVVQGLTPSYDASNGYVRYQRDANADVFGFSESSYDNYGNAAVGPYCNADGTQVLGEGRRRPLDGATITTDRYRYRYDGRWLMTEIQISEDNGATYGPDLVDRWKARAFQQDPGSETPCCGYEEEDTNWGGSSTLMGERSGPVRTIRETWGADSGTNVVRREVFYREEMRQKTFLRVHVIPPLDGIYAQWDYNAGRMTTFYNSRNPQGVAVDGRNDEVFGNFDDPCNTRYDANDTSETDQGYRSAYRQSGLCDLSPYHQSIDVTDPTFNDPNVALAWTQIGGANGTIVSRFSTDIRDLTPGGAAQSAVAVPYYRDDACFDDGTGTNPGPKINLRSGDEPTVAADGTPRRCWTPADGPVDNDDHFFQGDIGTHGVHILFLVDSDNARQTVPINEIISENRQVYLPGDPGNVGEEYGRGFEKPLVATVADMSMLLTAAAPKSPTTLSYDGDGTGAKDQPVELAAVLTDAAGNPVAGRQVAFTVTDYDPVFATTDDSGRAATTITWRGNARQREVDVTFGGDDAYESSQTRATITRR